MSREDGAVVFRDLSHPWMIQRLIFAGNVAQ